MSKVLSVLFILFLPIAAFGTTWYIPGDSPTIQGALDLSAADDTVLVACGTYYEAGLTMTVPVTLRGETGELGCVIIDAQGTDTILYCDWSDGTAILEDITFTGGGGQQCGGVCMTGSAAVTFARCIFFANFGGGMPGAGRGGAVGCFEQARAEFRNCRFDGNGAYGGGGLFCSGQAEISLDACVLVNNFSSWGGGVELRDDSICEITRCTFYGNNSWGWYGGGVTNWSNRTPQITSTIIAYSEAGSAIEGNCNLTDCDLFGNPNGDWVGAIADQLGVGCNMAVNPLFCGADEGDLSLDTGSLCLPNNNECGVQIGAEGAGCGAGAIPTGSSPASLAGVACYPNPFNPSTEISFFAPRGRQTTVTVHDIRGHKIALLFDGPADGGSQCISWNAEGLPSGVYFIHLTSGYETATEKVALLK